MGAIYKALERAQREHQASQAEAAFQPREAELGKSADREVVHPAAEEYEGLKTAVLALYPGESVKTVLFTGVGRGVGTSRTALNFAKCLAGDGEARVLLVDASTRGSGPLPAGPRRSGLLRLFGLSHLRGPSNGADGRRLSAAKPGPGNLEVIRCTGNAPESGTALRADELKRALMAMRDSCDYLVVDAPSVYHFPECRALCAMVDGVVLVIESGKTNRQAAVRAKKVLEDAGGKLLGVVLNKKRHYIPEFLYRRL